MQMVEWMYYDTNAYADESQTKNRMKMKMRGQILGYDNVGITRKTIFKLLNAPNSWRFFVNTKENSPGANAIKRCLFNNTGNLCSSNFRKVKKMHKDFKLLFK